MNKVLTPFILLSSLMFCYALFLFVIVAKNDRYAVLIGAIALIVGIGCLVVDFLLRFFVSFKMIWIVELFLIGLVVARNLMGMRVQKVIVPTPVEESFVSVVYGVEGEDPLSFSRDYSLSGEMEIPEGGVLWTSSSHENTSLPRTKFFTSDGEELKEHSMIKGQFCMYLIANSSFEVNSQSYHYMTWRIKRNEVKALPRWSSEIYQQQKDLLVERFLSRKGR